LHQKLLSISPSHSIVAIVTIIVTTVVTIVTTVVTIIVTTVVTIIVTAVAEGEAWLQAVWGLVIGRSLV
jgi:hypothetical protein